MAQRDTLLRLYKALQARCAALRNALAGELENLRRCQTDQTSDSVDGAVESGSEDISAELAEMKARELHQIERALARLKQGQYGICELCQAKIAVARLNAVPYGTTCIDCQREMESTRGWERRHGSQDGAKTYFAEDAVEEQRDIDPANIEMDLSRDR
jgi:DnaK suppressor protein